MPIRMDVSGDEGAKGGVDEPFVFSHMRHEVFPF